MSNYNDKAKEEWDQFYFLDMIKNIHELKESTESNKSKEFLKKVLYSSSLKSIDEYTEINEDNPSLFNMKRKLSVIRDLSSMELNSMENIQNKNIDPNKKYSYISEVVFDYIMYITSFFSKNED